MQEINVDNNNGSVGGYVPPQQGGEGGAAAGQDYYYYYEMPDGSIGYMTANEYNQMYSPSEEQQQQGAEEEVGPQPAGYVEPTYGQGTAYAPPQTQYITTSYVKADGSYAVGSSGGVSNSNPNSNVYCTYDNTKAYANNAAAPSQQYQEPILAPPVVYAEPPVLQPPNTEAATDADGMAAVLPPGLPHERADGGWYVSPPTFEAMRKWNGTQSWTTSLMLSCWREPCFCLGACVAPWCVVAAHRKRLLQRNFRQYRCCAGVCGRVDSCECCGGTPHCSLFWEILFCLPCSCHANRYMLMQRYNLKKSCWDSTVLGLGCCCAPFHWCGECTCWFPESMWDWLYVVVYACMLTQHHRELDAYEKGAA
jgi:hypothetical protein